MADDRDWLERKSAALRAVLDSMPDVRLTQHALTWDPDTRLLHCDFRIEALDGAAPNAETRCLEAACRLLETAASGQMTFIRAPAEAKSDTDFETGTKSARGWVRFATSPVEGPWQQAERSTGVIYGSFGR
jgi:hypothetical protein